jgi:signal transduction histidine kinase
MKLQSLNKDYKLFTNIVVLGAILISLALLHISYKNFNANSKLVIADIANKTNQQLTESLSYVNNISNFIGNQIISEKHINKESISNIILNTNIKSGSEIQDIFTWTLFDFIDQNGYVIASSTQGIIDNPPLVKEKARPWISEAKTSPWRLLASKPDIGIISKEPIIPFGFGISRKDGAFIGTISLGINVNKLKRKLQSISHNSYATFAIIDKENDIIISSDNFNLKKTAPLLEKLNQYEQGLIKLNDNDFFYRLNDYCQFKIIVGIDRKMFLSQLRADFFPKALNTLYLIIFFLILLYFFRAKLLKPVLKLSEVANQLSQGNFEVTVTRSEIEEVNSLALAIEKVKRFIINEELIKQNLKQGKDKAEIANNNKTEFLSSSVHELRNMLSGIIGLSELLKINLTAPSETIPEMKKHESENINCAFDIMKLGEESITFINDILDINQAQTGDFKIDAIDIVDLKEIIFRSINLMKIRAIKERKNIITNIDENSEKDFIAYKLDPRRVKQIIVNIISNAVKYSPQNSEIKVSVINLSEEESNKINLIIEQNIKNNHDWTSAKIKRLSSLLKSKLEGNNKRIAIEIEDNGYGMNEEELKIANQKYGTIKHDPHQKIDSTGLGLPIVRSLVEEQCGLLEIESKKNKGTKVRIIF